MRAILFDFLLSYGVGMRAWADRWLTEVADWDGLDPTDERLEAGRAAIERLVRSEATPTAGD